MPRSNHVNNSNFLVVNASTNSPTENAWKMLRKKCTSHAKPFLANGKNAKQGEEEECIFSEVTL